MHYNNLALGSVSILNASRGTAEISNLYKSQNKNIPENCLVARTLIMAATNSILQASLIPIAYANESSQLTFTRCGFVQAMATFEPLRLVSDLGNPLYFTTPGKFSEHLNIIKTNGII